MIQIHYVTNHNPHNDDSLLVNNNTLTNNNKNSCFGKL